MQVWPDEVTLTFGGAEARSRRRQGEAGGPGSPRPRPDPSHTHSSPPAPHILTCALAAHADQGACCSLCDGGGQGAVPHPHGGCWAAFCNRGAALSRKKLRVFACCVWLLARGQTSKSSMWSKRGKPPRLWRPYDSTRAGEALGAGAGVARATAHRQTRRQVSAGSAS